MNLNTTEESILKRFHERAHVPGLVPETLFTGLFEHDEIHQSFYQLQRLGLICGNSERGWELAVAGLEYGEDCGW